MVKREGKEIEKVKERLYREIRSRLGRKYKLAFIDRIKTDFGTYYFFFLNRYGESKKDIKKEIDYLKKKIKANEFYPIKFLEISEKYVKETLKIAKEYYEKISDTLKRYWIINKKEVKIELLRLKNCIKELNSIEEKFIIKSFLFSSGLKEKYKKTLIKLIDRYNNVDILEDSIKYSAKVTSKFLQDIGLNKYVELKDIGVIIYTPIDELSSEFFTLGFTYVPYASGIIYINYLQTLVKTTSIFESGYFEKLKENIEFKLKELEAICERNLGNLDYLKNMLKSENAIKSEKELAVDFVVKNYLKNVNEALKDLIEVYKNYLTKIIKQFEEVNKRIIRDPKEYFKKSFTEILVHELFHSIFFRGKRESLLEKIGIYNIKIYKEHIRKIKEILFSNTYGINPIVTLCYEAPSKFFERLVEFYIKESLDIDKAIKELDKYYSKNKRYFLLNIKEFIKKLNEIVEKIDILDEFVEKVEKYQKLFGEDKYYWEMLKDLDSKYYEIVTSIYSVNNWVYRFGEYVFYKFLEKEGLEKGIKEVIEDFGKFMEFVKEELLKAGVSEEYVKSF